MHPLPDSIVHVWSYVSHAAPLRAQQLYASSAHRHMLTTFVCHLLEDIRHLAQAVAGEDAEYFFSTAYMHFMYE